MPVYVYTDEAGHEIEISHAVNSPTVPYCPQCSAAMWRKPQRVGVIWNGLRPSQGDIPQMAQDLIDSRPKRLDKYNQEHRHD
jgi:hypothetical protein